MILGLVPAISGCGVKGDPIPYVNTHPSTPAPGEVKKAEKEAK